MTRRRPSRTSRSMRLLRSFLVSAGVPYLGPFLPLTLPAAEADWAASRVRSLAVSRRDEIRERDSIAGLVLRDGSDAGWVGGMYSNDVQAEAEAICG